MATILYPDGRQEERQPKNGHTFRLAELQEIVGDGTPEGRGYIEIIPTNDGRVMVLHEEGKLLDLPRNEQATALVNLPSPDEIRAMLARYGDEVIFVGDLDEADYIA